MTQIKYTEIGNRVRVSLHGHAQFKPGNDLVCAGLSAITFQMLNYLSVLEENKVISDFAYDIDDGHTIVTFLVSEGQMEGWHTAWKVISIGYRNLAEAYPENVMFK